MQFSALFSYMLWHIELIFCIWTLFYCTTDQLWVSSISVNFCGSYAPFGTKNTENTQFSGFFSYMLWHIKLKFCIWLFFFTVLQIKFECRQFASIFCRSYVPVLKLRTLKIRSFPHFSLTCCNILNWNFAYYFVLLYYKSSSSFVNLGQFLKDLCPFWNLRYRKYTVFRTFSYMLWHIELKFYIWQSYAWLPRKCDNRTGRHTDRQADGRKDRQTPDKVIPMCRYAS